MRKIEEVVIVGAGPAGYAAAIRLGQQGKRVTLIESSEVGGVCLNYGCIPSKSLLTATNIINQAKRASEFGIDLNLVQIDTVKLNAWKNTISQQLVNGVRFLLSSHEVELIFGKAEFLEDRIIKVTPKDGNAQFLEADAFIIATGSCPKELPHITIDGNCIISPEQAMNVSLIPQRLAILGGGVVGVELATIYQNLGCKVSIIEKEKNILPTFDEDIRQIMGNTLQEIGVEIYTSATLQDVTDNEDLLQIKLQREEQDIVLQAEKLVVAIGRNPNTTGLGLAEIGIALDSEGFVKVDERRETTVQSIYAIGDINGRPHLAHKAYSEAVAVADAIMEYNVKFPRFTPSLVFSTIEAASVGLTEEEAKENKCDFNLGYFPYAALGRAHTRNNTEGFLKVLAAKTTGDILGVHIAGDSASELISQATLALECGMQVSDFAEIIRPHPTLSEAFTEAAMGTYSQSIHFLNSSRIRST